MPGQNELPDAGWYPDPYGASTLRWWDGAQWTDAVHPPVAEPVTSQVVTQPSLPNPVPVVQATVTSGVTANPYPPGYTPAPAEVNTFAERVATAPVSLRAAAAVIDEDSTGRYEWSRESRAFDTFPGSAMPMSIAPRSSMSRSAETTTASSWTIVFMPLLSIVGLVAVMMVIASVPELRVAGFPSELLLISVAIAFYLITVLLALADNRRLYANGVDRPAHWTWALLSAPIYLIARLAAVRHEVGRFTPGKLIVHILLLAGSAWVVLNFEAIVWPFLVSLMEQL